MITDISQGFFSDILFSHYIWRSDDENTYHIPNPVCIPKYTKVKVLSTQDKHHIS